MSEDFTVTWSDFAAEQTPENLRIDKKGRRAWGFKRFTIANYLRFARRCKAEATVNSPFLILSPEDAGNDSSDEELDAFCGARNRPNECRAISDRILKRLRNSVGEGKTSKCIRVASALGHVPQGKLAFRYTAPVGANGPVCLMFRITNFALDNSSLNNIQNSEGVRTAIVTLMQNTALIKVVVR